MSERIERFRSPQNVVTSFGAGRFLAGAGRVGASVRGGFAFSCGETG